MPSYLPPIKVRFAEKIAGTIRVRQGSIPAEAKLWDWLNPSGPTLIATITADEMGIFPAQTFPSISDNSAISFEVTKLVHPFDPLLTVPYFGTHLIYSQPLASDTVFELFLKQVAYADQCVVFFQNIPIIDATDIYEDPVEVELYVRFEQETEQSWTYLGNRIVGSETEINIPYGVLAPLWISAVPISAIGRRPAGALPENGSKLRVDLAATTAGNGVVVGQITDATQTNVTLGLSNIPAHARAIEYQTADDDDFTLNVKTTLLEGDVFGNFINRLPDVVSLNRAAGPDTKTIHFRMRFSTYNKAPFIIAPDDEAVAVPREGESAVWSPWSDFKTVTFADSSGAGGSPGDGINNYERNMIEVLEEESESDITVGVPMFGGGGSSGGGARWNNIASPNGNQYLVMGNYQTGWGFAHLGAGERDNINIGDDGSEFAQGL